MQRKDFLKLLALAPLSSAAMKLNEFEKTIGVLPEQEPSIPAFSERIL